MSILPLELLSSWPQYWDLTTLLNAARVCKHWNTLFSLPDSVWLLAERWNEEEIAATVCIGDVTPPLPSLLAPHINMEKLWSEEYHYWWAKISLLDLKVLATNGQYLRHAEPRQRLCYGFCGKVYVDECGDCFCNDVYCNDRACDDYHWGMSMFSTKLKYRIGSVERSFSPPPFDWWEIAWCFVRPMIKTLQVNEREVCYELKDEYLNSTGAAKARILRKADDIIRMQAPEGYTI